LVCDHIAGLNLGGQIAAGSYGRVYKGTYFGCKVGDTWAVFEPLSTAASGPSSLLVPRLQPLLPLPLSPPPTWDQPLSPSPAPPPCTLFDHGGVSTRGPTLEARWARQHHAFVFRSHL
jgi:hypothetical protein